MPPLGITVGALAFFFLLGLAFSDCKNNAPSDHKKALDSEFDDLKKQNSQLEQQVTQLKASLNAFVAENHTLRQKNAELEESNAQMSAYIKKHSDDLEALSKSSGEAFKYLSVLMADYMLVDYDNAANYLYRKSHPAIGEGLRIKDLKSKTKEYVAELKRVTYTLDYIYLLFPELQDFIETVSDKPSDDEPVPPFTKEKWKTAKETLSSTEYNQMKLDYYVSHQKSKWAIGRDYELYVGYKYTLQGFKVEYYGSYYKLEDLGRDLIVKRNGEVGIIQCKYWSSKKTIHEKHIAQLYGTVVSYTIENVLPTSTVHGIFITNISLSPMAKKFAEYLGIKYKENYDIGDFPRIKCNIGKDEFGIETKIYHLPTDQQYDNVKIEKEGECFAFTVAEAEQKGFRHAYRWNS